MTLVVRSSSVFGLLPLLQLYCHHCKDRLVALSFELQTPGFLRNIKGSLRSLEDLAKCRLRDESEGQS